LTPRLGEDRPRLVAIEGLEISAALDPYLTLRALAQYSGCSVRWLRDRLTAPSHPLPCFRLPGGKILVRPSDFDTWLGRYRAVGHPDVEQIVANVLTDLTSQSPAPRGGSLRTVARCGDSAPAPPGEDRRATDPRRRT
jgi:hypothetical protein